MSKDRILRGSISTLDQQLQFQENHRQQLDIVKETNSFVNNMSQVLTKICPRNEEEQVSDDKSIFGTLESYLALCSYADVIKAEKCELDQIPNVAQNFKMTLWSISNNF